jgi:hypothetical protein
MGRDGEGLANFGELVANSLTRREASSLATRRVCLEIEGRQPTHNNRCNVRYQPTVASFSTSFPLFLIKAIGWGHVMEETRLKRTVFLLTIATFASFGLPGWATSVSLTPAQIITSLDQCESQICGSNPPLASYNGNLSGYSTETVGEGAFVSASGFSSPTLTDDVPLSGANVQNGAELIYQIEVVSATLTTVQLGVSSVGSLSVGTTGGPESSNSANALVQLALESSISEVSVFNDSVGIVYNAGLTSPPTVMCLTGNNSPTPLGAGVLNGVSVGCGSSSGSGGFTESGTYTIDTNIAYNVVMQANITVGTSNDGDANGGGTVQGIATIDPIFTVSGGTLEFSSGVGNSGPAGVPEPATWTMLAAGLGLVIAAKRRRVNRASRDGARAQ